MSQDNLEAPRLAQSSPLRAGVGRSDITVETPDRPVRDRLFAKVLAFDDGQTRLAIVTMDAVAIGGICDIEDHFLPEVRQRIESEFGIPGAHTLFNASHTHPPGRILCSHEQLIERTVAAVREAMRDLNEVTVGAGEGHEDQIIMNRNLRLKNGKHWTIRHANPCPPEEDIAGVGPIDPEIGILRVDRLDGRPLAVVYNFGCHLLFGDMLGSITGNIPAIASQIVEDELGEGVMAFFLQGAAGDIIDTGFKNLTKARSIEAMGRKLGEQVLSCSRKISTEEGKLSVISRDVELPRRTDILGRVEKLKTEQAELLKSLRYTTLNFKSFLNLYLQQSLNPKYPSADSWSYLQEESQGNDDRAAMDAFNQNLIQKYQHNIRAMERLAAIQDEIATFLRQEEINRVSGRETITAQIQGIRIGDYTLISAPIEVLTEVGMNVKKASPYEHTYIAAFSNGYMHYGPPADTYDKGGYEVTECFLAPEWQEVFESTARDILQRI